MVPCGFDVRDSAEVSLQAAIVSVLVGYSYTSMLAEGIVVTLDDGLKYPLPSYEERDEL